MTDIELALSIAGLFIGAISLLFSIFTAGIAFVAILEWKSYRDFQKKKREAEVQYKQVIEQMIAATENFKKEASAILISKKQGGKKQIKEQEKRVENLICQMENIIKKAENKLSTSEASYPLTSGVYVGNLSGTPSVSYIGNQNYASAYSLFPRKCLKCGKDYNPSLATLDIGLCDECKNDNASFSVLNK